MENFLGSMKIKRIILNLPLFLLNGGHKVYEKVEVDSPVAKPVIHDTMTEKPTDVKTLAEKFAFSDTVGVESTSAATSLAELAIDKSIAADPIVVNTYRWCTGVHNVQKKLY